MKGIKRKNLTELMIYLMCGKILVIHFIRKTMKRGGKKNS